MSTEPQSNSQSTISESNNSSIPDFQPYIILSQKPFPYNIRNWYPDIPYEKILEKLPNTQYPI